jgi:hypothetical protein
VPVRASEAIFSDTGCSTLPNAQCNPTPLTHSSCRHSMANATLGRSRQPPSVTHHSPVFPHEAPPSVRQQPPGQALTAGRQFLMSIHAHPLQVFKERDAWVGLEFTSSTCVTSIAPNRSTAHMRATTQQNAAVS